MNYEVSQNFENFLLKIKDIGVIDELHFSFTVQISTDNISEEYNFSEMAYWQLPYNEDKYELNIFDECAQDCKCKIDKDGIELIIKNDRVENITKIKFTTDDQEKVESFFEEFNAICKLQK